MIIATIGTFGIGARFLLCVFAYFCCLMSVKMRPQEKRYNTTLAWCGVCLLYIAFTNTYSVGFFIALFLILFGFNKTPIRLLWIVAGFILMGLVSVNRHIPTQQEANREQAKDVYNDTLDNKNLPSDEKRAIACKDPEYAYYYALDIDKCPRDDTRTASCNDQWGGKAYFYARDVDKCPRDDTRTASCKLPSMAYAYALDIDKCPRDDTRTASCENSQDAYDYAKNIDKCATKETREAAHKDPSIAWKYDLDFPQNTSSDTSF